MVIGRDGAAGEGTRRWGRGKRMGVCVLMVMFQSKGNGARSLAGWETDA